MRIVMGVDPGLASTGFGVIRVAGARMEALDGGVIESGPGPALERRLAAIHQSVSELLDHHQPEALALEDLYFGKNVRSAMAVGQARGVLMLAAAERKIECFDYTPQAVKMSVCGTGSAVKDQVKHMVASLLGLDQAPASDHAADALAVAICHASQSPSMIRVSRVGDQDAAEAVPR